MAVVATICARGGSKGLPGKNLLPLNDKPLIVHTIDQARACPQIDEVFVSTDDPSIAETARGAGGTVLALRPAHLARDDTPKMPVVLHLLETIQQTGVSVDRVVDLQPTSPLRLVSDIESCLNLLDDDVDVVITGYESEKNPYFDMVEIGADGFVRPSKVPDHPVLRRQDAPVVYAMNGSIYVWHGRSVGTGLWGGRTRLFVMPRERSVDIDSYLDFRIAEMLMNERDGATQR